jgi:predicted component of type VI protein secretion system
LTGKRPTIEQQEFVLESSGRAVLAFLADGLEQARELCSQHWFMDELVSYRSCGHPIWDGTADLRIRYANPSEAAEVQIALAGEQCRKEYDGYVFVFFVPVDAGLQ